MMLSFGEASVRRRNDEMSLHSPTNECVESGFPGRIREEIAEEARQESCEKKGGRCCCMGHAILPMQFAPTLEQGRRWQQSVSGPTSNAKSAGRASLIGRSCLFHEPLDQELCIRFLLRGILCFTRAFSLQATTPVAACMNDALPSAQHTPHNLTSGHTPRRRHLPPGIQSPESTNHQFNSHGTDDGGPKRFHISSELTLANSRPFRQNWECQ